MVLEVMQRKGHLPWFDSAYQGYASGDLDADAYSVRLFESAGMEMVLCQSFSKNLGLYGKKYCLFFRSAFLLPRWDSDHGWFIFFGGS